MRAVFGAEIDLHPVKLAARSNSMEITDVAAGAKGARLRADQHNMCYVVILGPSLKHLPQCNSHVIAQSIERLRPVDLNKADMPLDGKTDIVLLHCVAFRCWLYVGAGSDHPVRATMGGGSRHSSQLEPR